MAVGVARFYKEEDNQVTLIYTVDGVLKSSQVNLANWGVALDALKALVADSSVTPGSPVSVTFSITTQ